MIREVTPLEQLFAEIMLIGWMVHLLQQMEDGTWFVCLRRGTLPVFSETTEAYGFTATNAVLAAFKAAQEMEAA